MNGGVWPALQPIGCRSAPKLEMHFPRRQAARSIKPAHGGTVLARHFSTSALLAKPVSQSPSASRRLDEALDAVRVQHRSPPTCPQPSDQCGAISLSVEAIVTMAQRRIRRMELELRGLHRVASGIEPPQAARRSEHLRVLEELLGLEEELKRYQLQQWRADEELAQVQARVATMESEAAQGEAKRESLADTVAGLQAALQRATEKMVADAAKAEAASKAQAAAAAAVAAALQAQVDKASTDLQAQADEAARVRAQLETELQVQADKASAGLQAQAAEAARVRARLEAELQAQADEAARVRAQLETELAERTACASQLEQACKRMVAEMLKERTAGDSFKDTLEATLAQERARMEANAAEAAAALQAQVDESAYVRAHLEAELAERTANVSQLEQACTRMVAEMLKERAASDSFKDTLEAAKRSAALQVQADEAARVRAHLEAELQAQADEAARVRAHLGAEKEALEATLAQERAQMEANAVEAAAALQAQAEEQRKQEERDEWKRVQHLTEMIARSILRRNLARGWTAWHGMWEEKLTTKRSAALQAQVDEAARMRAHLEADLAERTANASQLEQACTRLAAELLKERAACVAENKALEAALAQERARMEANAAEAAAALQAQVDEVTKLRVFLKVMLVLGLSIKDESEEESTSMRL